MSSLRWHAYALLTRLLCRLTGHQDAVRFGRGTMVTFCRRCHRSRLERVEGLEATAARGVFAVGETERNESHV